MDGREAALVVETNDQMDGRILWIAGSINGIQHCQEILEGKLFTVIERKNAHSFIHST